MSNISRRSVATLLAAGAVALPATALLTSPASAGPQPNMEDALAALRAARASLIAATPNKGGHRGRAIELVNEAIAETIAGINFANTHY